MSFNVMGTLSISKKLQEESISEVKTLETANLNLSLGCLVWLLLSSCLLSCFSPFSFLRPAEDDSGLHWHGSVHHPVWVDHWCAGLLQTAGAHAVCGWAALPNGR